MRGRIKAGTYVRDRLITRPQDLRAGVFAAGYVFARAFNPAGVCFWEDGPLHNIVVNQGLDHMLDIELSNGTQITAWHVLLQDGTPTNVAGDTYQSHAGWVEITAYAEATRELWVDGGVSAQSVDNSASVASFAINATTTVGGVALVSDNTKADSGAGPFLYSQVAFSADRALNNGDTLEITYTQTLADDGV